MNRYLSTDMYYKNKFGEKVVRLSLSSGLSCPNRDGTISKCGCIFCDKSGSGNFAANKNLSIENQIESQIEFLSKKWKAKKFIAYFQNFTNKSSPNYCVNSLVQYFIPSFALNAK